MSKNNKCREVSTKRRKRSQRQTNGCSDHSYCVTSGACEPNEPSPDYMHGLDKIICEFMKEQDIPGASLCIHYEGKPFYKQGYGIARCGQGVTSDSYFRIASISKVVTAIAVLKLMEEGCLELNTPVFGDDGILPEFRCYHVNQSDITVLHLLQHSAGWDRDLDQDHVFWYSDPAHRPYIDVWNNSTLIQYVLTHKLAFEPGSRHAYSNLTYMLLGNVIEKVSGQSYIKYVTDMLQPIFGNDIYIGRTTQENCNDLLEVKYFNSKQPDVARSVYNDKYFVAPQYGSFPMENSGSYGGLVTSAEFLVQLLDSLVIQYEGKRVLSPKSVELMFKRPFYSKPFAWYGLGLDIEDSGESFGHSGAMDGTTSTVHHDKGGHTWALLLNSWATDVDLDGLMKYALSMVPRCCLWQSVDTVFLSDTFNSNIVFTSTDTRQCVSLEVPHSTLKSHAADMKLKGYTLDYTSALRMGSELYFNLIWSKSLYLKPINWTLVLDLKRKDLSSFLSKLHTKKKVSLCQSYVLDREICHLLVVLDKDRLAQEVECVEESEHETNTVKYIQLGFVLVCQSAVWWQGRVYITAIYSKLMPNEKVKIIPEEQMQWSSLPVDQFLDKLKEQTLKQYRLDHLQFYTTENGVRVSAIWTKMNIGKIAFTRHIVYQRYNVSKYGLLNELRDTLKVNKPAKCLCSYMDLEESAVYFVCIWARFNRKIYEPRKLKQKRKIKDVSALESNSKTVIPSKI